MAEGGCRNDSDNNSQDDDDDRDDDDHDDDDHDDIRWQLDRITQRMSFYKQKLELQENLKWTMIFFVATLLQWPGEGCLPEGTGRQATYHWKAFFNSYPMVPSNFFDL